MFEFLKTLTPRRDSNPRSSGLEASEMSTAPRRQGIRWPHRKSFIVHSVYKKRFETQKIIEWRKTLKNYRMTQETLTRDTLHFVKWIR
jgi:hypothetical protein